MRNNFNPLVNLVAAALLFLIAGCSGIAPELIKGGAQVNPIELKAEYVFLSQSGKSEYRIAAGIYNGVAKDSEGIYYAGPKRCWTSTLLVAGWGVPDEYVNKVIAIADCGIFVPNDGEQPPKVYTIIGTGIHAMLKNNGNVGGDYVVTKATDLSLNGVAPVQAGVGAAIGVGIVGAMIDAEQGRFLFVRDQSLSQKLRHALIAH